MTFRKVLMTHKPPLCWNVIIFASLFVCAVNWVFYWEDCCFIFGSSVNPKLISCDVGKEVCIFCSIRTYLRHTVIYRTKYGRNVANTICICINEVGTSHMMYWHCWQAPELINDSSFQPDLLYKWLLHHPWMLTNSHFIVLNWYLAIFKLWELSESCNT